MHFEEFKNKVKQALPEEHPLQKEMEEVDALDGFEELKSVLDVIEDWRRGIRDWSEVQDIINQIEIE